MLMAFHHALFKKKSDIFTVMKRKINYLIWGCSLAMLAMTTVQVYFIYNTYALKEKEAQGAVRLALISMEKRMNIDSIRAAYYTQGEALLRSSRIKAAVSFFSEGSPAMSRQVSEYIRNNPVLNQYHTTYRVVFSTVSLRDFSGRKVELKDKLWFSNGDFDGKQFIISDLITDNNTGESLVRNLNSRSSFSIHDGKNSILREMLALMIFSVVLISSMILLFYFSIRSLITQKKISDMQTDFINNITHEFNTPLATMAVALSTARSQGEENSIGANALSVIDRQHRRLKKLIDQVVTYTSGSNELVLHKEKIALQEFINKLLDDFQAANPDISLIRIAKAGPSEIMADPFYLTTAINNLLENAVKYGGTELVFTAIKKERNCLFAVADNGIGIPQKEIANIFHKFYRVEKGDIHTAKGLGLGLYYTCNIAAVHGGELAVDSIVDQGSTFTMTIPII